MKSSRKVEPARAGVEQHPMIASTREYSIDAYTWLRLYARGTREKAQRMSHTVADSPEAVVLRSEANRVLEALEVLSWDKSLIADAVHRALQSMDYGAERVGEPLQASAHGPVALALLLMERSEAAWRLIARWAPESEVALQIADAVASLRAEVERAFPNVRPLIRAKFDETAC